MSEMVRRHRTDGFTLVELLVVILIIGILAAIAIPIYLSQVAKSGDAAAKSDLRNLALYEETYSIDAHTYGTIAAISGAVQTVHASKGVTLSVVDYIDDDTFCLSAMDDRSHNTWFYDSGAGGPQPAGTTVCPVTVGGTAGDTITG